MKDFLFYLENIQELKKDKKFDEAWKVSNEWISDLLSQKDDSWYFLSLVNNNNKVWVFNHVLYPKI